MGLHGRVQSRVDLVELGFVALIDLAFERGVSCGLGNFHCLSHRRRTISLHFNRLLIIFLISRYLVMFQKSIRHMAYLISGQHFS